MLRWSGVKLSPENRPLIYQLLLPALQPEQEPDLVVRLTAAKALKIVIDDFEFCTEEVRPHLQLIFQSLFQLLQQVGHLVLYFSSNHSQTRPPAAQTILRSRGPGVASTLDDQFSDLQDETR